MPEAKNKHQRPPKPPPKPGNKLIIRRNAPDRPAIPPEPATKRRNAAPRRQSSSKPRTFSQRMQDMGASHVAAGIGTGTIGNILGVIVVGKGWVGPKTTAGIMLGTGVATATAGIAFQADHLFAAGAGLTAAGGFSLATQLAIDGYEAAEKRAEDKRKALEQGEREKLLAEARASAEAEQQQAAKPAQKPQTPPQMRNARRLVILDRDGNPVDYDDSDPYDEYAAA